MHLFSYPTVKAHKSQFDKLVEEAKERMKKARASRNKTASDTSGESSTSSTAVVDVDENSRESVTIMQIEVDKTVTESTANDGSDLMANPVLESGEAETLSEGAGNQDLATVPDEDETEVNDGETGGEHRNACVSLSFTPETDQSKTIDDDAHTIHLPTDQNSSTVPVSDTAQSSSSLTEKTVASSDNLQSSGKETDSSQGPLLESVDMMDTGSTESMSMCNINNLPSLTN